MKQTIFAEMVKKPGRTKKWLYFPLSVLFHGLIIAVAIAIPLLSTADSMPQLVVATVTLVPPSPPIVPLNRGGGGGRQRTEKKDDQAQAKPKAVNTGRLVAQLEIPEDIEEESIEAFAGGFGNGPYIDGAPEGDPNGVPGGRDFLLPDDFNNQTAIHVTTIQQPRLLKKIEPIYPRAALLAHIQGVVVIEAVTNISGNVVKTNVLAGHPLLKQAAIQAVMQWIYEPYIFNGIPKPVIFTVRVNFKLQNY